MVDDFWPPRGLFPRVDSRFRADVHRMAIRYTAPTTVIAMLMCIGTHVLLDGLRLLPYPIWPAVLIGTIMAGLFTVLITWVSMVYTWSAYYHLEAAREEFERLSRTDALTGLLNRRAFVRAFADTPRVTALALFDIDHFKKVNDRFGHGGGDAALVETSQALGAGFTAPDVVARIGGEEFAVLVGSCAGDDAVRLVERARCAIGASRVVFETHEFSITVSVGIAHADEGKDIDALLLAADRALYLAKGQGRDRLVDAGGLAVLRSLPDRPAVSGPGPVRQKRRIDPEIIQGAPVPLQRS